MCFRCIYRKFNFVVRFINENECKTNECAAYASLYKYKNCNARARCIRFVPSTIRITNYLIGFCIWKLFFILILFCFFFLFLFSVSLVRIGRFSFGWWIDNKNINRTRKHTDYIRRYYFTHHDGYGNHGKAEKFMRLCLIWTLASARKLKRDKRKNYF